MKKILLPILALGGLLFASSCQMDEPDAGTLTGEVDFSITAGIPSGITTYSPTDGDAFSHLGGINNVTGDYVLRFILEVYDGEAVAYTETKYLEDLSSPEVTFNPRLLAKEYDFVFWADFVEIGDSEENRGDLYYNTSNGLTAISYKENVTATVLTTDLVDAYYANENVNLTQSSQSLQVTLQRPFGKIRLLATDNPQNQVDDDLKVPTSATIAFTDAKVPTTFNARTGKASEQTLIISDYTFTAKEETDPVVTGHTDLTSAYLLGQTYFFESPSSTAYNMTVTVRNGDTQIGYRELTNIPVSANKLTTVIGNFYTNEGSIDVIIEDEFGGESEYDAETAYTSSFDEIIQALAAGTRKIVFEGTISGRDNLITIPADAPAEFSIDLGSNISGYSPTLKLESTDGDDTQREITIISQTKDCDLILDINTANSTYTLEGRYAEIINRQATSLVKTMGYITKLTLFDGDAEIYANLGALPTAPHNYIKFNGSGVIKNVLIDTGAELSSYGSLANQGKCEKICLGKDLTYVREAYLAGDIDLNDHTITIEIGTDPDVKPYLYVEKDLTMYNGSINYSNSDKSFSVFQIKGTDADIDLNNVDITSDTDVLAVFTPCSISLTDCNITTDYSAISTNAASSPTVDITIEGSTLTGKSTILKNVPGQLTINNSTIMGTMHGVIVRGGDALISNSNITLTYDDTDYQTISAMFKNENWGQGNQLPLAAMTIGNRSESSYRYPTNVILKNTDLILTGAHGDAFPALYAYANQESGLGVTLTYDEYCQFDKCPELASANITVNGGSRWTGAYAEPVINESTSTIIVNSADQLAGLANLVNTGNKSLSGYTVTLNTDIDLGNKPWTPIGNGSRGSEGGSSFSGVFDGNGHTIRNINVTEDRDNYGAGLFSVVKGGTVKNITVEGGSIKAFDYGAAVVGIILGESTLENCHARNVEISSGDAAAGIVARAYGTNNTIIGCTNSCDITEAKKAGGIVGIASNGGATKIENCSNSGTVYASDAGAAGILGYAGPATNSIINCQNSGTIGRNTDKYAGGIVGYQASTNETAGLTIEECTNSGEISAINAGGIYGIPGSSQPVHISKSVNNGNVTGVDAAGGIACRAGSGTIENCTNTANITAATENKGVAGGIAGNLGEAKIINCSGGGASAVITAQYPGRLVGHVANKPYSPDDVEASITIDDSNGDDYSNYKTIAAMGLYTTWSNINIEGGTLHGKPAIDGQASGYIKIHSGAAWDQYPDETGTWKCSPTDNNVWSKVN